MEPDRRRSLIVTLTLLGLGGAVVAAPLVPEGKQVRRNVYTNRDNCVRDYSPGQCEAGSSGAGSGGGSGIWRGPAYYSDRFSPEAKTDAGAGRSGLYTNAETSIRGGFGRVGSVLRMVG